MRYRHSLFVANQETADLAQQEVKDWIGEKDVLDLSTIIDGVTSYIEVRFYTRQRLSQYAIDALKKSIRPAVVNMNIVDRN